LLAVPVFAFAPRELLNPLLSFTAFPALLLLLRNWNPSSALVWLGDRSFSIYLMHSPVFWAISMFVLDGAFVRGGVTFVLLVLSTGLVLILSDLSYRFLETPARRWIVRGRNSSVEASTAPVG
jgi:peptidoglycan/LPS O-acetylase OafA/YrhL